VIYQVRLDHQVQQIRDGLKPDNLIRPEELPPLARAELREAFMPSAAPSSSSTDLHHLVCEFAKRSGLRVPPGPARANLARAVHMTANHLRAS